MVPLRLFVIFQGFRTHMVKYTSTRLRRFLVRAGLVPKIMSSSSSPEIRHMAYTWSRDSVGGVWAQVPEDQLDVQQISGGLSNYLYLCTLPEGLDAEDNVPRKVLMRVYGEIAQRKDYLVRNSVIFAIFSEKKLGPKLYGMYPQGRIEEYIPARALRTNELANPKYSSQIAKKLAYFHTLEMPLCKSPSFLQDQLEEWLTEAEKILSRKIRQNVDQKCLQKLKSMDLRKEWHCLLDLVSKVDSPVVFSHNDLQEGNILLNESETDAEKQLTLIDLEYCSYNYRGFDFGNHFCEWTYNYTEEKFPNFTCKPECYPSKEEQYQFFRDYLTEKRQLRNDRSEITEDELVTLYKEATVCAVASHYLWGIWSIVQLEICNIEFGYLEYACDRLDAYFKAKQSVQDEGLV